MRAPEAPCYMPISALLCFQKGRIPDYILQCLKRHVSCGLYHPAQFSHSISQHHVLQRVDCRPCGLGCCTQAVVFPWFSEHYNLVRAHTTDTIERHDNVWVHSLLLICDFLGLATLRKSFKEIPASNPRVHEHCGTFVSGLRNCTARLPQTLSH